VKVTFQQSGGFAGLAKTCELDTKQMAPDQAALLESLVEQSHLPDSLESRSPRARDANSYVITVEGEGKRRRIAVDDRTMPDDARPLVQFLQKCAQPRARR
jgi:hypothetical protein